MKTARKIEIPKDRALTEKEAEKILKHAKNSSFWYFTHGASENKVRQKLMDKGYSKEPVEVIRDDDFEDSWDLIELAIEHCKTLYVVDDDEVAESIIRTQASKGHGSRYILHKLQTEGFDRDSSQYFVDNFFNDDEAFEKALQKATRKWYRLSELTRKEYSKTFSKIASEGFPTSKIRKELDTLKEELFDEDH